MSIVSFDDRFAELRAATASALLQGDGATSAELRQAAAAGNPPVVRFTLPAAAGDPAQLACYLSGAGRLDIHRPDGRRVELRPGAPLPKGRSRLNCTLPGPEGRWQWYGTQFYVKP